VNAFVVVSGGFAFENGTSSDAVAVLIEAVTNRPRRAIFIRNGESGAMTAVPQGTYRLRFHLGWQWTNARRFCRFLSTSDFEDAFDFNEITEDNSTRYDAHEVTLHPVLLGNAKAHIVSDALFELPEP
jgi:hypothetical protein